MVLQMPQGVQVGAAQPPQQFQEITDPTGGVQMQPPGSPQELTEAKSRWAQALEFIQQNPELLASFGAGMMTHGNFGQATLEGLNARAQVQAQRAQQEMQQQMMGMRERELGQAERRLGISERDVALRESEAAARQEERLASRPIEQRLKEAQAKYYEALAQRDPSGAKPGGTQLYAEAIRDALMATNPNLSRDEAFLEATRLVSQRNTMSQREFELQLLLKMQQDTILGRNDDRQAVMEEQARIAKEIAAKMFEDSGQRAPAQQAAGSGTIDHGATEQRLRTMAANDPNLQGAEILGYDPARQGLRVRLPDGRTGVYR